MTNKNMIKEKVIERLGGTKAAAEFFGISVQAIYMWPDGEPIPPARIHFIKAVRPDLLEKAA